MQAFKFGFDLTLK